MSDLELLQRIRDLVGAGRYRVRVHALRHMIEEGFGEHDLVEAISENSAILETYSEESRCLIGGRFSVSKGVHSPLHVVCDYRMEGVVDFVTAYVPQRPWWITPTRRGGST